jgi:hypothetical protein
MNKNPDPAKAQVESAHPGWEKLVRTAAFRRWLAQQTLRIRALAASNNPEDAIALLTLFKHEQES